jgi:hypothetical protein
MCVDVLEAASMRLSAAALAAGLIGAPVVACAHREPPAPDLSPSVALPEFPPPAAEAPTSIAAPTLPAPSSIPSADPAFLPQTRDVPRASGPGFEARVATLWNAIVRDEPERAMPFFFPLGAYEQVKDIPSPSADWKHRLVAAYARDIHALHGRLDGADGGAHARLVGLDVPEARARWVEPGEEYNKIGYFRVFGSRLRYELDGAPRAFEIKSLISWRGEWYVVHLSAVQ